MAGCEMVKCAVPECSNVSGENKTFWPAPKQEAIRKQWFRVLGVPISLKSALICEDHFQVEGDGKEQGYSDDEHSYSRPENSELHPNGNHKRRKRIHESQTTSSDDVENSQEQWRSGSSPIREGSRSEDSDDSTALVIKCEPEDDFCNNEDGEEQLVSTYEMLGNHHVKVEADPIALEEDITHPTKTGVSNGGAKTSLILEQPYLEILDQPEPSYRFRYKRESSKPHGPLKGRLHVDRGRNHSAYGPRVKLCNFHGEEAILRVWLFCGAEPSPHQLVSTAKVPSLNGPTEEVLQYEPHQVIVSGENDFTVSFSKLNILHVVCGDLDYQKRYYIKKHFALSNSFIPPTNLPPFDPVSMKEEIKRKEKDIACLFIEAFEKTDKGYRKLCDIISENIKNKKSPKTNDLKILKQSHEEGSCRGNQQVLIFTEKLIKDVSVEFFEEDEDGEITWSSKASFKESDIHKQVAISFWTPPYKDLHISNPVPVFFRLVRATDGATSHNRTYTYLPSDCPCRSKLPDSRMCISPTVKVPEQEEVKVGKVKRYQPMVMPIMTSYTRIDPDTMAKLRVPQPSKKEGSCHRRCSIYLNPANEGISHHVILKVEIQ
uniref:Nuclear factor NF-kappa-B p110 subunit n=1 Tax=Lygus hesperus TaxID=30085 RepID=A0A0A9W8D4_LYGHE